MNKRNLAKKELQESKKLFYQNKDYYFYSDGCYNNLFRHFMAVAYTTDAFSGESIIKTDALIGLEKRGRSEVVYFKNLSNFKNNYVANTRYKVYNNKK